MAFIAVAILLGAILGFAAHRASICTVRAVAEVMSSRSGYMLASIAKSVLWVWAVTAYPSPASAVNFSPRRGADQRERLRCCGPSAGWLASGKFAGHGPVCEDAMEAQGGRPWQTNRAP
jgi:hypothetical protein